MPLVSIPEPGTGTIIGTVQVQGTNNRLTAAGVRATPTRRLQGWQRQEVGVDSLGGFALTNLPPGKYKVLVRSVGYRFHEQNVVVRAARVDTLRTALAARQCTGY
jgi:Carboxypeptidase regulatory-like domain